MITEVNNSFLIKNAENAKKIIKKKNLTLNMVPRMSSVN